MRGPGLLMADIKGTLLFDLDNTLINRDAAVQQFFEELIARCNIEDCEIQSIFDKLIVLDQHGRTDRLQFCRMVCEQIPAITLSFEQLFLMHRRIADYVCTDKAVCDVLSKLRERYDLLVVSNGSSLMQRTKMKNACIDHFFENCIISGEVGFEKPDCKIFELALSKVKNHPVAMIGDDYERDIISAKKCGITTVLLHDGECYDHGAADCCIRNILCLEEKIACII
jgi:putative hydrolase of the HAD superfamily